ncbi:hypothetical protein BKA67DRAFT_34218 [Truncatella angustata]|uniref:Uncharacterized protein n=1 Tax=Truncatella angustata TaxID=152316 RepID=A0A9P8UXG2_9PEZI|nr:uncharacterized protein BKA67DRAFT_34218 [Truncatella angustata]KAH6659963.1 hypothetical protein BKA67DRAFT_34218 [Truncatella angustata]
MEALQLAQMLADLNDLQAADQGAAKALVAANKNLEHAAAKDMLTPGSRSQSQSQSQSHTKGAGTPPLDSSRIASPGSKFDKLGRRMFTPPLSRNNSHTPSSASIPGTPGKEETGGDISRATTLLSLYEIRAKLKEQDNSSLQKAREKINALAAKQQQLAVQQQPPSQQTARRG